MAANPMATTGKTNRTDMVTTSSEEEHGARRVNNEMASLFSAENAVVALQGVEIDSIISRARYCLL
jgi:hypothetical protein